MFDPAIASYLLGLAVAIAGSFFGAAIGSNFAFTITGITVLTSFGIYLGTDSTAGFTYLVFGPFVGPHVAFTGGVGVAAYAGRRGYADSKDATSPLARLGKPDVLWVGVAFGVFGYVVQNLIAKIPWFGTHTDPVTLTVALSAVVARLVAKGSSLNPEKYNDSPSFLGKITLTEDAAWLRYQEKAGQYLSLGAMLDPLVGSATLSVALAFPDLAVTGNVQTFTFAVSAVCVMFLVLGAQMPVTHHITISAGLAAVAFLPIPADNLVEGLSRTNFWDKLSSNEISLASLFDPGHASYGMLGENAKGQLMMVVIVALLVSVGIGMLAAWLAEFQARLFYNRGNTRFDPPAAAIWIANTIIASLISITAPLFQEDSPMLPTELYQAYVFDLDGTTYLGDHLLPGVARLTRELRRRGIPVRFLSNNPTKDLQQYVEKLARLGLPTDIADIANTVITTTRWLQEHHPDATLFVMGEEPLKRALTEAGFRLSDDPERIDIVVASYDRTFDYSKLQVAFDVIWFHRRATLTQINPDRFCPFPGGRREPDCAAIIVTIEACTGVKSVTNLGRPSSIMLEEVLRGLDMDPAACVMVGDRLHTDVQMALDTGMAPCLMLTGETTPDDVAAPDENHQSTYVLDRIDRLIPQRLWDELGWTETNWKDR